MPSARRVVLVHWDAESGAERARAAKIRGFRLELLTPHARADCEPLRTNPPDVVAIDLSRLPSHGREFALGLRGGKATKAVPIVFVGGAHEKVAAVRARVPDAIYCTWDTLGEALRRAISAPTAPNKARAPVPPSAGYSGTPLPQKIGIKDGARVLLVNAPPELDALLAPLPRGAELVRSRARGAFPVVWLFVTARADLERDLLSLVRPLADKGHLWVSWPKKTSGVASDVTEDVIRDHALAIGLVDTKVCAVDATWSGLRLNRRAK